MRNAISFLILLLLISCGHVKNETGINQGRADKIPPSTICDLQAETGTETGEIILTWTAVGDDWMEGAADEYIVKCGTEEITHFNFEESDAYLQDWVPNLPYETETYTVTGLVPEQLYHFAIKVQDKVNNTSCISNSASAEAADGAPSVTILLATGGIHSMLVDLDGNVWTWGRNNSGQLGDGSTTNSSVPIQVTSLSGIVGIGGGSSHSVAVKSDGTVWTWGNNYYGQLGDGTTTERHVPGIVPNLTNIIAIAVEAGDIHTLALRDDCTIWAWGYGNYGQLGNGSNSNSYVPVQVLNITTAITLCSGTSNSSAAILSDGTMRAWGNNVQGMLGDGTTTNRNMPVQVIGLTNAIACAHGSYHSIALQGDGTVWTWGSNSIGQLGDGTTTDSHIPIQVPNIDTVVGVSAGGNHSLALKNDGTVWTWGYNAHGRLGDGTTIDRYVPGIVPSFPNVVSIVGGGANLVLKNDESVWAWGSNNFGQVGDGTTVNRYSPVQIR